MPLVAAYPHSRGKPKRHKVQHCRHCSMVITMQLSRIPRCLRASVGLGGLRGRAFFQFKIPRGVTDDVCSFFSRRRPRNREVAFGVEFTPRSAGGQPAVSRSMGDAIAPCFH